MIWCTVHALRNTGVMASSEKQRLKHLLVETIQVLCRNSLPDESSFCVEATIGITLSSDRAMVISFKERVSADGSQASLVTTGEQDCEQQRSKKTKDETYSHSSFSNVQQHMFSESPTVSEQTEIEQTHGNVRLTGQDFGMLENSVVDSRTVPSHMALSRSSNVSAVNHCYASATDNCYAVTQTVADHETDSTDEVVIFKVEEGTDSTASVNDGQQLDTAVAAPSVQLQSASYVTKQKQQHERFGSYMVHNHSGQPASDLLATNEIRHVDGSRQQMPAFDVS